MGFTTNIHKKPFSSISTMSGSPWSPLSPLFTHDTSSFMDDKHDKEQPVFGVVALNSPRSSPKFMPSSPKLNKKAFCGVIGSTVSNYHTDTKPQASSVPSYLTHDDQNYSSFFTSVDDLLREKKPSTTVKSNKSSYISVNKVGVNVTDKNEIKATVGSRNKNKSIGFNSLSYTNKGTFPSALLPTFTTEHTSRNKSDNPSVDPPANIQEIFRVNPWSELSAAAPEFVPNSTNDRSTSTSRIKANTKQAMFGDFDKWNDR